MWIARMTRRAWIAMLAGSALAAAPATAQPPTPRLAHALGVAADRTHGLAAFEALSSDEGWTVCRAGMFGCSVDASATVVPSDDGTLRLAWTEENGEARSTPLTPSPPHVGVVAAALSAQCVYAGEAGEELRACVSAPVARGVIDRAARIYAALVDAGALELTEQAIHTRPPSIEIDAGALAVVEALDFPRASVATSLARFVRRGDVRLRDGESVDLPPVFRAAIDAALVPWMTDATRDHECSRTCGGCIPMSRASFERERREVPVALREYVHAIDDALWVRHVSIWTLTAEDVAPFFTGVDRLTLERRCGASDWPRASFRACARRALLRAAAPALGDPP